MTNKAVIFYKDWIDAIKHLPDATQLSIIRAVFEYGIDGILPDAKDDVVLAMFGMMKATIDVNNAKYQGIVDRNRSNGLRGGRPRKEEKEENPVGFLGNPKKPKKPIYKDKDKDKDKEIYSSRTVVLEDDVEYDKDISSIRVETIAGAREEPPDVEEAKEVTWRDSFDVYLMDLRAAWGKLTKDPQWMADRERFNPGVNVKLTLEKACKEFWATEAGWKHKKKGKSKTINWRLTLATAVSLKGNRVYYGKQTNQTGGFTDQEREMLRHIANGNR